MEREVFEYELLKESLRRCSQNNFNQAEAGYNAKWFRKGGLFGAKWKQERMYSEEEVNALITLLKTTTEYEVLQSFRDKVEQFKKK